jgi:ABC-2 type transport system ATP-binding protein
MHKGKILAQGTLDELLSQYVSGEVIEFSVDKPIDQQRIPNSSEVRKIDFDPVAMKGEIVVENLVAYLPQFLELFNQNGTHLTALECRKMTLDDLFISLTGRQLSD